jgi:SAM-dependent methyltransferase
LIVYDGYRLDAIPSNSIDLVFSDQLIEHFHPEDTKVHFELVHRILKPGGKYVFRTPHALTGPHDVSQYFSYEAEGFHLKEWTYTEIKTMLSGAGYSELHAYWNAKGTSLRVPYGLFALCELLGGYVPKPYARVAARYLFPSLSGVAVK